MSRYPLFDREQIVLADLSQRGHDLTADDCRQLDAPFERYAHPEFAQLVENISQARRRQRPVILLTGGHPIKLGLSRYLIDLIERGLITHVAANGSVLIHDFELALGGGTSENVPKWIARGQFGRRRPEFLFSRQPRADHSDAVGLSGIALAAGSDEGRLSRADSLTARPA